MSDLPDPATQPPPSFHLLAKPTGSACNLECAYCFFLEKEQLYPGVRARMSDELLERYIRQLIESHRTPRGRRSPGRAASPCSWASSSSAERSSWRSGTPGPA